MSSHRRQFTQYNLWTATGENVHTILTPTGDTKQYILYRIQHLSKIRKQCLKYNIWTVVTGNNLHNIWTATRDSLHNITNEKQQHNLHNIRKATGDTLDDTTNEQQQEPIYTIQHMNNNRTQITQYNMRTATEANPHNTKHEQQQETDYTIQMWTATEANLHNTTNEPQQETLYTIKHLNTNRTQFTQPMNSNRGQYTQYNIWTITCFTRHNIWTARRDSLHNLWTATGNSLHNIWSATGNNLHNTTYEQQPHTIYAAQHMNSKRRPSTLNNPHHHGGPSVSRMALSVPLICGYGSGSAGRSWTCRAVRSLGTGSSHLSLGYKLPSGGVLWRTVLDGDALPLAQMMQIVKVCASAVCPEQ